VWDVCGMTGTCCSTHIGVLSLLMNLLPLFFAHMFPLGSRVIGESARARERERERENERASGRERKGGREGERVRARTCARVRERGD
jgi:hypothetical protein